MALRIKSPAIAELFMFLVQKSHDKCSVSRMFIWLVRLNSKMFNLLFQRDCDLFLWPDKELDPFY